MKNYHNTSILVNGQKINRKPEYLKAYNLTWKIIKKYDSRLKKHYNAKYNTKYDLSTGFSNYLYWSFCLPRMDYKLKFQNVQTHDILENRLLARLYNYSKSNIRTKIVSILSIIRFLYWLVLNMLKRNTNKIFIEETLLENYRFDSLVFRQKLEINKDQFLFIFDGKWCSPFSYNYLRKKGLFSLLKDKCEENIGAYVYWIVALRLLKPKKIIILDDSGNKTYSLVLAAKKLGIIIVGVSHGQLPPNQPFAYGPRKSISHYNPLKFDRYYVWDSIYKNSLIKYGNIYSKHEIKVCGWLKDKGYKKTENLPEKKYVLYALEHFVSDLDATKECLQRFSKMGYKIIIKNRPTENLPIVLPFDFELVDDFGENHINRAYCSVGHGSTMIYDLSAAKIPVVVPYKDFQMGMNLNFVYEASELIKNKVIKPYFKPGNIKRSFINEFEE